ncbi:hypothetical protein Mapa_007839 [Marchantia paleacea]|nr:hypothetical protein Mapa_007839 [Marchantia paleacea]
MFWHLQPWGNTDFDGGPSNIIGAGRVKWYVTVQDVDSSGHRTGKEGNKQHEKVF